MKTTDLDRQTRFTNYACDLYRRAISCRYEHLQILEHMTKAVWQDREFKGLPEYRRAAIRAVFLHLFHGPVDLSIYQHLEYRMLGPDGKYYAKFEEWRALFPEGDAALIYIYG